MHAFDSPTYVGFLLEGGVDESPSSLKANEMNQARVDITIEGANLVEEATSSKTAFCKGDMTSTSGL